MINTNYSNSNNYNPNFTSIRIVKTTPEQFVEFRNNFKDFCSKSYVFRAESLFHANFYKSLINVAIKENLSPNWIISNAEKYGLFDSKKFIDVPMHVFTGEDAKKFAFFNLKSLIKNSILAFNTSAKTRRNLPPDYPTHLIEPLALKNFADKRLSAYNKFLAKQDVKYVDYDEFISEVKSGKLDK